MEAYEGYKTLLIVNIAVIAALGLFGLGTLIFGGKNKPQNQEPNQIVVVDTLGITKNIQAQSVSDKPTYRIKLVWDYGYQLKTVITSYDNMPTIHSGQLYMKIITQDLLDL